ncbi:MULTISPECIES: hypothetical protein [Phaeobacter]|uniref:hypothetical protein n=1 Tax=Phaeobacter TaxID=302485 RepID=UPI000591696B|nr:MULTISPECIES: hypothetical protein [Phaeobacter]KII12593.1 hypothetical protein OO25_17050 [Phaeobacter sp. S60]
MEKISIEESTEFLASLVAMAEESNSDQEFLNRLSQLGWVEMHGLRGCLQAHSTSVLFHFERLSLERKMIAHLIG